ncbi:MAG: polysaccharide biosynthesis/export family protein, partial [Hydrogenophaga sp.]|nr:polysaccharide biosynthesis/export family protein [Hydrogenophaga sp.]
LRALESGMKKCCRPWGPVTALALAACTTLAAQAQMAAPALAAPMQSPVSAVPRGQAAPVDPATGEPAALSSLTTVGADYRISANDLLEFDIFGVPDMKRDIRVNASGLVSLPLIGPVAVAGLTAQDAEKLIAAKYAEKYLQDPQVSLFIKEFTTQRITIEGAVSKPGIYPVTGQLTLLRALALSGGFAPYANINQIVVYRSGAAGQREQFVYDLDKVRAGEEQDASIQSDDVIVVQRSASRAALRDSLFRDILDTLNPFSWSR